MYLVQLRIAPQNPKTPRGVLISMVQPKLSIVFNDFALRQFQAAAGYLQIHYDTEEFTKKVRAFYDEDRSRLKDGYAPFCKHLFIENFTDAPACTAPINAQTEPLLRCAYESRRPEELKVLTQWLPRESLPHEFLTKAKFLDIILYSKEQIGKEDAAMGKEDP